VTKPAQFNSTGSVELSQSLQHAKHSTQLK